MIPLTCGCCRSCRADADRSNVELARLVELSPAATLHRVRRLKESGIVRGIVARLDSTAAGFPLQVYVAVTLARHDDAAHRRFAEAVRAMPEVIAADWVTGETDAMLMVVAREVAELQRVLVRLSTRGGAAAGHDAAAAGGAQASLAAAARGGPEMTSAPGFP